MLKKEFIELVSEKTGETKVNTERMVAAIFETIGDAIAKDDSVQISDFGTFKMKQSAARNGINPATRLPIQIPARKGISLKSSTKLKEKLNK